jgi:hypothetical protein
MRSRLIRLSVNLFWGEGGFCIKVIGFPGNLVPKPAPTLLYGVGLCGLDIVGCDRRSSHKLPINYRNAVGAGLGNNLCHLTEKFASKPALPPESNALNSWFFCNKFRLQLMLYVRAIVNHLCCPF